MEEINHKSDIHPPKKHAPDFLKSPKDHSSQEALQFLKQEFSEKRKLASGSFKEAFVEQPSIAEQSASEDATDASHLVDSFLALLRDSFLKANSRLERELQSNDPAEYDKFIKGQNQIFYDLID